MNPNKLFLMNELTFDWKFIIENNIENNGVLSA